MVSDPASEMIWYCKEVAPLLANKKESNIIWSELRWELEIGKRGLEK